MKSKNSELTQLKDKSFTLNLILSQEEIKKEYQNVLSKVAANFESKGFRKGKAPLNVVEQNVSPSSIYEEIIESLLSQKYQQKVNEYKLKPIISPQVKLNNPPLAMDKNWDFSITSCEAPEIKLNPDYKTEIGKLKQPVIITKKDESAPKTNIDSQILDVLLKNTTGTLPQILIDAEINHRLSHLVEQINQAGLTLDQYFQSNKTTLEKYKEDQTKVLSQEWFLNMALDQIAQDQKIEVKPEDLQEILKNYPKDSRMDLNLVTALVRQQKTLDFLRHLV